MSKRILIVDDSGYSRTTLRGLLEEEGFDIVGEAKDGAEALDQIELLKPDLVTLDNIMPDMTGMEILRALKADGIEVNIIMISAVAQQSAIDEALSLGVKSYLIKPFTKDQLIQKLKSVFE
ncbi:MAG: two-component system chemotaxis response regulator CheY [Marinoscillum sp.]|jgi:two-component system chemotaxis response regulator CheY